MHVESCRASGDEILCRRAGGTIGIPSAQVARIVEDDSVPPAAPRGDAPRAGRKAAEAPPLLAPRPGIVVSEQTAAVLREGPAEWQERLGELERSLGRPGVDDRVTRREMAVLHTYAGNAAAEAGDFDAAEAAYLRATDQDPTLAPPRLNLVRLRLQEGRNDEAERILSHVRADDPGNPAVLELLGEVAYRGGRVQEAIASWESAIEISPDADLEARLARIRREETVEQGYFRADGAHFILKYDGDRASDALSEEILDHLDATFEDLSLRYNTYPTSPFVVTLYSREAFEDVTDSPRWVGGLFDGQIRVPIGGLVRLTEVARNVFTHELAHAFVHHKTRGNCPRWLQEGIAQWSEGKSTRTQRRLLARELAGASPAEAVATFSYPRSLSLLEHFLATWTFSHLLDVLEALGKGATFDAAFAGVTGREWMDFVEAWLRSLHAPGGVG